MCDENGRVNNDLDFKTSQQRALQPNVRKDSTFWPKKTTRKKNASGFAIFQFYGNPFFAHRHPSAQF